MLGAMEAQQTARRVLLALLLCIHGASAVDPATAVVASAAGGVDTRQRMPNAAVKDRLAVIILYAHHASALESKMPALKQNVKALATHLLPWTPIDVLIWYHSPIPDHHKNELSASMEGNCAFIRVEDQDWQEPMWLRDEARNFSLKLPTRVRWTNKEAPLEVRRSGLWHVTKPFQYALAHGYEFALKWDGDLMISSNVNINLVDFFRTKGLDVGHMGYVPDDFHNLAGLAEITRYYITTQGPRVYQLFEHCNPPDINGLYWNENGNKGWSGEYYAHAVLMRTSLFTSLHVNEYLRVICFTGGLYRHRWNENAIYTMLSQIWVPKEKAYEFGFAFTHNAVNKQSTRIP